NKITRRWAKRGTRPSAPHDQRTASAYIFGAICPADGKGAGLVLPSCNSEAMALHLEEISLAVAPGAHAILLLDQAGWHVSKKLPIPDNITLLPLPPKSPELNPVENIWQFMRDHRNPRLGLSVMINETRYNTLKKRCKPKHSDGAPAAAIHVPDLVSRPDRVAPVNPAPIRRHCAGRGLDPTGLVAVCRVCRSLRRTPSSPRRLATPCWGRGGVANIKI